MQILVLLFWLSSSLPLQGPVIGVYTQDYEQGGTYITANYVKWL
jgi:hypothetical protein